MNQMRRRQIETAVSVLSSALDTLQELQQEEQDAYDNLPEGLQGAERGMTMEEAANALQDAVDSIAEAIQSAENAIAD